MLRSEVADKLNEIAVAAEKAARIVPSGLYGGATVAPYERKAIRALLEYVREACIEMESEVGK